MNNPSQGGNSLTMCYVEWNQEEWKQRSKTRSRSHLSFKVLFIRIIRSWLWGVIKNSEFSFCEDTDELIETQMALFFFVILFHRSAVKFTPFASSPLSSVPPLLFPPTPPLQLPSPTPLPFYTCHAGYHLWYKLSYMSWNSREVIPWHQWKDSLIAYLKKNFFALDVNTGRSIIKLASFPFIAESSFELLSLNICIQRHLKNLPLIFILLSVFFVTTCALFKAYVNFQRFR